MGNCPATQTCGKDFNVRQLNPRQRSKVSLEIYFLEFIDGILNSANFKLIGYSNDKDFLFK